MRIPRHFAPALVVFASLISTSASPRICRADWPPDGLRISDDTASLITRLQMVRNPAGDYDLSWVHTQQASFFQISTHVSADGVIEPGWSQFGNWYGYELDDFREADMIPDGSGGMFVATVDRILNAPIPAPASARHLLADGTMDPLWPAIQDSTNGPLISAQNAGSVAIASDAAGGAFVIWQGIDRSYRLTRVRANGQAKPTAGFLVSPNCTGGGQPCPLGFGPPSITPDGSGGLMLLWQSWAGTWMQHFEAAGVLTYGDPLPIGGSPGDQGFDYARVFPSGAGEFICAWVELVGGTPRLVLQKFDVNASIAAGWPPSNFVAVHPDTAALDARVEPDGSGGAYAAWRVGAEVRGIRIQSDGSLAPGWPVSGIALGDGLSLPQTDWGIAPSDQGGLLFAARGRLWWHQGDGTLDPAKPAEGVLIHPPILYSKTVLTMCSDGSGGAVVAWDWPNAAGRLSIMLSRVDYSTPAAVGPGPNAPATFALRRVSPNPARGSVSVEFALPDAAPARLEFFDTAGRRMRSVDVSGAGEHSERLSALGDVRPGLYLVRLTQGGRVRTARVALLR
jgi:hypothetical protein